MSEDIARDCYVEYMRDDSDDAHGDFLRIVGKAIADARTAGYAEAIEASKGAVRKWAAQYPLSVFPEGESSEAKHASWARHTCAQIEREISELASAATTEEPK